MAQKGHKRALKLSYWETKGIFYKRVGKTAPDGREKKFYLGSDRDEAERRALAILQLWDQSNLWGFWDKNGLTVAQAISKGKSEVVVNNSPVPKDVTIENAAEHDQFDYELNVQRYENEAVNVIPLKPYNTNQPEEEDLSGPTLHEALDAFQVTIELGSKRTRWKITIIKELNRLKKAHSDLPLSKLGYDGIKALGDYWLSLPQSNNPRAKYTGFCIAPDTAISATKRLRMFFDWLDGTDTEPFNSWRFPRRYRDLLKYKRTDLERLYLEKTGNKANGSSKARTFNIEELKAIWQAATKSERLYIALALNTGSTQSEIAHLRQDEIFLDPENLLGEEPYIQRDRTKTGVEGKFLLWDVTTSLLRDYLPKRNALQRKLGNAVGTDPRLAIVSNTCRPVVDITELGSRSDKVASAWYRLLERLKRKGIEVPVPKGFKTLRKSGAQFCRDVSDDETASIFLSHSNTSPDKLLKVYSNRDYSKLDAALLQVRERLSPVFDGE